MRNREIHFKQIPLEKVKMIIEKERQRRKKTKRAAKHKRQRSAKTSRMKSERNRLMH